MAEYNFDAYPTDPDAMSEYLREREAAGNPMTREEGEAYMEWNKAKVREMAARIERMSPAEQQGKGRLEGLGDAMSAQFDMEDARFEVQIIVEAAEDAERAAQGKRPLKRERDITTFEGFSGMGATPRGW